MIQKPNRLSRPQWSDLRRGLILDCPILFDGDYNDYSRFNNMSPTHDIPSMAFKDNGSGPAYNFASDSAELNSTAIVTYPCSMELVITPSSLSGNQFLAAFPEIGSNATQPYTCVALNGADSEIQITSTSGANRRAGNIGSWAAGETHHVFIVWYYDPDTDSGNSRIWFDGLEVTEHAEDYWNAGTQSNGINFGHRNGSPSDDYVGLVDSIKVWDREVLEHEIVRLANDPWLDYREDTLLQYHGAIHGSTPTFNPFWAVRSNQIL